MSEKPPGPQPQSRTLWHGRFGEGPSDELLAFTVSLPFDRRLADVDIEGSRAHVTMRSCPKTAGATLSTPVPDSCTQRTPAASSQAMIASHPR